MVEIDAVLSASAEMSCVKLANFCGDDLLSDCLGTLQYFQVHREFFPKHLYNIFTVSEFCNNNKKMLLKQVGVCIRSYGQRLLFKKKNLAGGTISGSLPGPELGLVNENNWNFQGVHLETCEIWVIKLFSGHILQMQTWRRENFLWQDWWQEASTRLLVESMKFYLENSNCLSIIITWAVNFIILCGTLGYMPWKTPLLKHSLIDWVMGHPKHKNLLI